MSIHSRINNHICIFILDLLFFNGEVLINKSLRERKKCLSSAFVETVSVRFPKTLELEKVDNEEINEFMSDTQLMKCTGIIGKTLDNDSEYNPGLKSLNWIKINKGFYKPDLDSLNFVIIGAKYGQGESRRIFSCVLLACYNEETDNYEALVLTHGALKERQLGELYYYLQDYIIQYIPSNYKLGNYQPDVIFYPKVIIKCKSFFVCLNPNSAVGFNLIADNMGLSIRFPKINKIREDKKISQICTTEKMVNLYETQDFLKEGEPDPLPEEKK